ncbi:MAG: hypothetical protein AAGA90_02800 [Actinomycetota bacterium]
MLEREIGMADSDGAEPSPPSRPSRWLAVAAAGLVIAGAGVVWSMRSHADVVATEVTNESATRLPGTEEEGAGVDGRAEGWSTAAPSVDQLPPGTLAQAVHVFTAEGSAGDVATAYLDSRFPDREVLGVAASEEEITERHALFRWQWERQQEGEAGWLYLFKGDGRWHVVAATTDGVDMSHVRRDSRGIHGTITTRRGQSLALDLTDIETGAPFDPATGELVPLSGDEPHVFASAGSAGPPKSELAFSMSVAREQFGIRVQQVGGTVLSVGEFELWGTIHEVDLVAFVAASDAPAVEAVISASASIAEWRRNEPANTRSLFHTQYSATPEVSEVWEDSLELVSFAIAIDDDALVLDIISQLRSAPGVLAVAPRAEQPLARRAVTPGEVIADRAEVDYTPAALQCAPLGVEGPANRVVTVTGAPIANSAEEALLGYLATTAMPPPWTTGFTEYTEPDGTISYAYAEFEHVPLGVISLEDLGGEWRVSGWEAVGC